MNKQTLLVILAKEIRSATRNRSLILFMLVVPLLVFPVLIFLPPIVANPSIQSSPVFIVNMDTGGQGSNLTRQIAQTQGLLVTVGNNESSPQAAVQAGLYDLAVVIPGNFSTILAQNQTAVLQVYYASSYSQSIIALGILNGAILSYSQQIMVLKNPANASIPVGVMPTPLQATRPLVATVANLLPSLWTIWAIISGAYLGLDMSASENEGTTLPVLMASPSTAFEISTAKTLSLVVLACFSALIAVAGVYVIPTMGVLIGSGMKDTAVSSSIPLSTGTVGILAFTVALDFALSSNLFAFLSTFLTGASRRRGFLVSFLAVGLTSLFLMTTVKANVTGASILIPYLGPYLLSRAAISQTTSLLNGIAVGGVGVLFGLLLLFLTYREYVGEGLLQRTAFRPPKKQREEEKSEAGPPDRAELDRGSLAP